MADIIKIAFGALLIATYCFWRHLVIPPLVTWAVGPETWPQAAVVYVFTFWLMSKPWAGESSSIRYVYINDAPNDNPPAARMAVTGVAMP